MFVTIARGQRLGHHVDEAPDGVDAVRMGASSFRSKKAYDAIFMDCIMPIMDGPTAAREMLAIGYTGPIIGFTGRPRLLGSCCPWAIRAPSSVSQGQGC